MKEKCPALKYELFSLLILETGHSSLWHFHISGTNIVLRNFMLKSMILSLEGRSIILLAIPLYQYLFSSSVYQQYQKNVYTF